LKPLLHKLAREPLVHFLLVAAALYALYALWNGPGAGNDTHRIVVDRGTLLRYMQFRAQAFEPAAFDAQLDALSDADRQRLINEYVREEALYREAIALGLDRDDNVLRLRLVQKMSYLLERPPPEAPVEAELQKYYAAHRQEYAVEPAWTFAHVYLDASRGQQDAEQKARRMLQQLNSAKVQFNDAPRYSDRFPYLLNYVERTPEYIEAHFGPDFMAALDGLAASGKWQGPLRSNQGWHLLLITAHQPGRVPELAEVRTQVIDDYRRERAAEDLKKSEQELVGRYQVVIDNLDRRLP
jgi:peptidyl-prolyl cis-trans isomerase C